MLQLVRSFHLKFETITPEIGRDWAPIESSMNCIGLATCSTIWTILFVEVTGLGDFKADIRADVATGVLESAGVENLLVLIGLRRSGCD